MAEVIAPPSVRAQVRELMAALAAQGVTATCSLPDGPRYGYQELDSNLPDLRICLGGPDDNSLTAAVLAAAGPAAAAALDAQLAACRPARGSGCPPSAPASRRLRGRARTCAARWTCPS